jgi:hypothetical protein
MEGTTITFSTIEALEKAVRITEKLDVDHILTCKGFPEKVITTWFKRDHSPKILQYSTFDYDKEELLRLVMTSATHEEISRALQNMIVRELETMLIDSTQRDSHL